MGSTSRKTKPRMFEVLISFDGLNAGERFDQEPDDLGWAMQHVENGYLRDVTDAPPAYVAQGLHASAEVPADRVQEAQHGSEERTG